MLARRASEASAIASERRTGRGGRRQRRAREELARVRNAERASRGPGPQQEAKDAAGKHPALIVHEVEPFNAEPPLALLGEAAVTSTDAFFVRNHGSAPEVDAEAYRLRVSGLVERPLRLSMDDIRTGFPRRTVVATLHCAGNRRRELMEIRPIRDEVPWEEGAVGTAVWKGAPLRDVLLAAGPEISAGHVAFTGLDEVAEEGGAGFGSSVPLQKAMEGEVLLAYEMNGAPLPVLHGAPLRVVVPGYVGARSVKWLADVRLQAEPSASHGQARAYKLFPPHVDEASVDWERGLTLGELSVNAVIWRPGGGERLPAGRVTVEGYAVAGGPRWIHRVDVSADEGDTWVTAELGQDKGVWAWRTWRADVELPPGNRRIVARAWESSANTQPERPEHAWNFKGYVNNTWHHVDVRAT